MNQWTQLHYRFFGRFRKRRMNRFFALLCPSDTETLLDVGGAEHTWTVDADHGEFPVVLFNIAFGGGAKDGRRFRYMIGSGTAMPFGDGEFSIAHSNSVIEHVGDFAAQQRFAAEIRRVAQRVWVQTPALCFPVEVHLWAPLIHWLPKSWGRVLARFTPRGLLDSKTAAGWADSVRLLNRREMEQLFPDCEIIVERVLGWPKSYVAVRRAGNGEPG
jgi:hypothetical protein